MDSCGKYRVQKHADSFGPWIRGSSRVLASKSWWTVQRTSCLCHWLVRIWEIIPSTFRRECGRHWVSVLWIYREMATSDADREDDITWTFFWRFSVYFICHEIWTEHWASNISWWDYFSLFFCYFREKIFLDLFIAVMKMIYWVCLGIIWVIVSVKHFISLWRMQKGHLLTTYAIYPRYFFMINWGSKIHVFCGYQKQVLWYFVTTYLEVNILRHNTNEWP